MNHAAPFICWLSFALFLAFPANTSAVPRDEAVILGVFPYISANQMVEQITPLCKRIEATLGKKVIMVSAPDFLSHMDRTAEGEYDLVLTAAHMGRLAELRHGWQRIACSAQETIAVVLTRRESGIQQLEDLRGKKLAVATPFSITYLLLKEALDRKGIIPDQDITVIDTGTFSNVVKAVFLGDVDAGATPSLLWDNWEHVNKQQQQELHEIFRSLAAAPSILVMASPATDQATIVLLRQSLLGFKNSPEGRDFFHRSQLGSFVPLDDATMERIDPYVPILIPPQ